MYKAIQLRSLPLRGLRFLPRHAAAPRAGPRFASVLAPYRPSQLRSIVPTSSTAFPQLRSFSLTARKLDSPSSTVVTDSTGTEHDLAALAKKFADDIHEKNLTYETAKDYVAEIKQGPHALAKRLKGQMVKHHHAKLMRTAEIYVAAKHNVTSVEELVDYDVKVIEDKSGPTGMLLQAQARGGTFDEDLLARIEEGDKLLRTKEGFEKMLREDDERMRESANHNSTITEGMAMRTLYREKWVGNPRALEKYLPGGPFEIMVRHIGEKMSSEIAEEMEKAERAVSGGELSPVGPTRACAWRLLAEMGVRDQNKDLGDDIPAILEAILPSTITPEVVDFIEKAELELKRQKGDESTSRISDGPASYMAGNLGKPMDGSVVNKIATLQAAYLGTDLQGHNINIMGTPAYVMNGKFRNRNRWETTLRRKTGVNTDSEHALPTKDARSRRGVMKPPVFMPPMDVVNSYVYNIMRSWEELYREKFADELKADPKRNGASVTRLLKQELGAPVDLKLYEKVVAEERLMAGETDDLFWWNGPASFIRRMKEPEGPSWLENVAVQHSHYVETSRKRRIAGLKTGSGHIGTKIPNIVFDLEATEKKLAYTRLVLRDCLPNGRTAEQLLAMSEEDLKNDKDLKPSVVETVAKLREQSDKVKTLKHKLVGLKRRKLIQEKKIVDITASLRDGGSDTPDAVDEAKP